MDDDDFSEITAKLDIIRERAEAHEAFVSPPGQPPLLWQMAMLADAGFTVLPPVRDPDPDRSFPEVTVAMTEVERERDHYCLVGGERFSVMALPPDHQRHFMRPKPRKVVAYFALPLDVSPVTPSYDAEHYERHDMALAVHGEVRWRSRIMLCRR